MHYNTLLHKQKNVDVHDATRVIGICSEAEDVYAVGGRNWFPFKTYRLAI